MLMNKNGAGPGNLKMLGRREITDTECRQWLFERLCEPLPASLDPLRNVARGTVDTERLIRGDEKTLALLLAAHRGQLGARRSNAPLSKGDRRAALGLERFLHNDRLTIKGRRALIDAAFVLYLATRVWELTGSRITFSRNMFDTGTPHSIPFDALVDAVTWHIEQARSKADAMHVSRPAKAARETVAGILKISRSKYFIAFAGKLGVTLDSAAIADNAVTVRYLASSTASMAAKRRSQRR
jgi:hypothetical protein